MKQLVYTLVFIFFLPFLLVSQDIVPPQARCKTGLVVPLPTSGTVTIRAAEFDDGSTDDVTPSDELKFYFDNDPTFTSITVDCSTFEMTGSTNDYTTSHFLTVEDAAGNIAACGVEFKVQDNKNICGFAGVECSGCVYEWRYGDLLTAEYNCDPTDYRSCYSVQAQVGLSIQFCKNDSILNGISTKDLVAIQRHLLGLTPFDRPEVYIAADVNNNSDVSSADISALRKLILGKVGDFSEWNQTSYRIFVKEDSFGVHNTTGELKFGSSTRCPKYTDFIGIKIGDVFGDNGFNSNVTRSEGSASWFQNTTGEWELHLSHSDVYSGGEIYVRVDEGITFNWESTLIQEEHTHVNDGVLKMTWVAQGGERWVNDDVALLTWFGDLPPKVSHLELYDVHLNTRWINVEEEDRFCALWHQNVLSCMPENQVWIPPHSTVNIINTNGQMVQQERNPGSTSIPVPLIDDLEGIYFIQSSVCDRAQKIVVRR